MPKIISWNVNGLKSYFKDKNGKLLNLTSLINSEKPDIMFLEETKLSPGDDLKFDFASNFDGYKLHLANCQKKGYCGLAVLVRTGFDIINIAKDFGKTICDVGVVDYSGRIITVEMDDCYIVNTYVPNAGQNLKNIDYRIYNWDPYLRKHLSELETKKPVIWCGDLNVARHEIDLARQRLDKICIR